MRCITTGATNSVCSSATLLGRTFRLLSSKNKNIGGREKSILLGIGLQDVEDLRSDQRRGGA